MIQNFCKKKEIVIKFDCDNQIAACIHWYYLYTHTHTHTHTPIHVFLSYWDIFLIVSYWDLAYAM